jgi:hypothetical protein
MTDWPRPRTVVRKGNFPYKFKIVEDYVCESGWTLDQPFHSQWLEISTSGQIRVKANEGGYAWDGCTPKWSLLNLCIVGAPDGHIDYRTMQPYTYAASLVHDALYQYLDSVPVAKEDIDRLFLQMLGDFKLRRIYYWFVRCCGGRGVRQRGVRRA